MGSVVHFIDPIHRTPRPVCRIKETERLWTPDIGLVSCQACKNIMARYQQRGIFKKVRGGEAKE